MSVLAMATRLREEIGKDPILRDYIRRSLSPSRMGGPLLPLTDPVDVLGERAAIAGALLLQGLGEAPGAAEHMRRGLAGSEGAAGAALCLIGSEIYRADPYLWLSDVWEAAAEQDVPRHTFAPESVGGEMWWSWDVDRAIVSRAGSVIHTGILWRHQGDHVEAVTIGRAMDTGGPGVLRSSRYWRGFRYPDDVPAGEEEHYRVELALLSFLNSPYIPRSERRIDRRLRKTFEREGAPRAATERPVHFIDLRSAAGLGDAAADEAAAGEHRHRWVVRGHHRAQWYPSLGAHKVIWISPYVKGPEGAPMLLPAYRVRR